jgi:hypothetical protein
MPTLSDLTKKLREIQGLTTVLDPLVEDGREGFRTFCNDLKEILDASAPIASIAIAGPVSSGKSTVLSSLLHESKGPLSSVSPSNETFAPMCLAFSEEPRLTVHYFGTEVISQIDEHLSAVTDGTHASPHTIALYKDARSKLHQVEAVLAGHGERNVVRRIDLTGQTQQKIRETLRDHVAQSSKRPEVYGVFKAEYGYPGDLLRELKNIRLIDMYGFDEPSPLVSMKFSRFLADEKLDAVIYVFSERSVSDEFSKLFELPCFEENIVASGRLVFVLNKADAYPSTNVRQWQEVERDFRKTIAKHVPILRTYVDRIPIFIMSAAAVDERTSIQHAHVGDIRKASLQSIQGLRDRLRQISTDISSSSSPLSLYLGTLFDLLSLLDVLARGVELNMRQIEASVPAISSIISEISGRHTSFVGEARPRLEAFRGAFEERVDHELSAIDYRREVTFDERGLVLGSPENLLRWMTKAVQSGAASIYRGRLANTLVSLGQFIEERLHAAYQEYVQRQDDAARVEIVGLPRTATSDFRPLWSTLDHSARELLRFAKGTSLHMRSQSMFDRFVNWYVYQRLRWDLARGQTIAEPKEQVFEALDKVVTIFMKVYVCEDPELKAAYLTHVCVGGEPTFWQHFVQQVTSLEELLGKHVQLATHRFGLYSSKKYFVSNRPEYQAVLSDLLRRGEEASKMIVELA